MNILVAPEEIGRGSIAFAELRYSCDAAPSGNRVRRGDSIDPKLTSRVSSVYVGLRQPNGQAKSIRSVDSEVESWIEMGIKNDMTIIVHHNASSKTGLGGPSIEMCMQWKDRHPGRLFVVLDAAQARFSRRQISLVLEQGAVVFTTGSKFFQGPPFSGALMIPNEVIERCQPTRVPSTYANVWHPWMFPEDFPLEFESTNDLWLRGLAARWVGALANISRYYQQPQDQRRRVLEAFGRSWAHASENCAFIVPDALEDFAGDRTNQVLFSFQSICSFSVRLGREPASRRELERLRWRLMSGNSILRALVGQPVSLGNGQHRRDFLRVALGSDLLADLVEERPEDPERGLEEILCGLAEAIDGLLD
jgi:hypothetical protein